MCGKENVGDRSLLRVPHASPKHSYLGKVPWGRRSGEEAGDSREIRLSFTPFLVMRPRRGPRSPRSANEPRQPQTGVITGVFARLLRSHLPGGPGRAQPPFWGGGE